MRIVGENFALFILLVVMFIFWTALFGWYYVPLLNHTVADFGSMTLWNIASVIVFPFFMIGGVALVLMMTSVIKHIRY